jgi:hypothetical protein
VADDRDSLLALAAQEDGRVDREDDVLELLYDALAEVPRDSVTGRALIARIDAAVFDRWQAVAMAKHYRQRAEEMGK